MANRRNASSKTRRNSNSRSKNRSFIDTLFNHESLVGNGQTHEVYERGMYAGEREEYDVIQHWGRKEYCGACARSGKMGDFENLLTVKGWLVTIVTIVLIMIFAINVIS